MNSIFEKFKIEAEELLKPFVDHAKKYYANDEAEYFIWLQKAAFLKQHKPDIDPKYLTPESINKKQV